MANEAFVSRIQIDYSDGSYDDIKLAEDHSFLLYNLNRIKNMIELPLTGAYSAGAIAAFLFYNDCKGNKN